MSYSPKSKFTIICPNSYTNKVLVIKTLRELAGLGLKEAKDASETLTPQHFNIAGSLFFQFTNSAAADNRIEDLFRILRIEGVKVGGAVHSLLDELRELAQRSIDQEEDELANEILQLVLAEKLRRNDDGSQ